MTIKKALFVSCLWMTIWYQVNGQERNNTLEKILLMQYDKFKPYLENPNYNVQIIYSQIQRDKNNKAKINTYQYNVNSKNYIYPASTVKLPVILLSLEKLQKINQEKGEPILSRETRMTTLASKICPEGVFATNPQDTNPPSIALYAEKMLLVSDNPSFARLYEFLGQRYIYQTLQEKKYDSIRIIRRLGSSCYTETQNKCTNAVLFYDSKMQVIYKQEEICNDTIPPPIFPKIQLGKAHIDGFGKYQNTPLDFTNNNFMALHQLHQITIASLLPEALEKKMRFDLTQDDYLFLWRLMGAYPREGKRTSYTPQAGYFDAYKKYLFYGQDPNASIRPNIRIFNIVGLAYGYSIDSAYIVDFDNNVEFFLTASIYTNRNETLNDNAYEYASEGMPFLKILGETIYKYELAREKKYKSNLEHLKIF
jgi:hypothetical protein